MRDFKGMKRQRSRNRNGGSGGGGGGGKPQHNANRAFESNGPEGVKVRGAAQGVYEKYQQMARDAQTAGDRVLAENYLQHAEHYFRVMRVMQPQRPLSEIIGRDQFVSGYDMDFEDESGAETVETEGYSEGAETADGGTDRQPQSEGRRDDFRQNDPRRRDEQPRQDRYAGERSSADRQPNDRYQNDRNPVDRTQSGAQTDRPKDDRPQRSFREDRPRYNRDDRAPRGDNVERDPLSVTEPEAAPLVASPPSVVETGAVLRAGDGDVSQAPAFLQLRVAEPRAEGGDEARKPRRRRAPPSFESGEVAAAAVDAE